MSNQCYVNPAILQAFWQVINQDSTLSTDPVVGVYSSGQIEFDHEVDYFDQSSTTQYSINYENIKAAGTLYYLQILADMLGVLRVADHVLLSWTSGHLDIPFGATADAIYRYYKLSDDRTTAEERAMMYKMVFDIGDGETLSDMTVNKNFTPLWNALMNEVVRYIHKTERSDNPEVVSKSPIYQSITAVQHNLSRSTSGIVKVLVPEMYAHLEDALTILNAPEVVGQLGQGLYKDVWNVIERVSMEKDNYLPNVQALRDIAVFAHKIFMAIADFTSSSFSEADFQDFIFNAESFIIAQGQLGDQDPYFNDDSYSGSIEDAKKEIETMQEEWDF